MATSPFLVGLLAEDHLWSVLRIAVTLMWLKSFTLILRKLLLPLWMQTGVPLHHL